MPSNTLPLFFCKSNHDLNNFMKIKYNLQINVSDKLSTAY